MFKQKEIIVKKSAHLERMRAYLASSLTPYTLPDEA